MNQLTLNMKYLPCDTNNCRDMSQGLTPINASSTIRLRTQSGSGRPLTNTPPNWLTPAWPESLEKMLEYIEKLRHL